MSDLWDSEAVSEAEAAFSDPFNTATEDNQPSETGPLPDETSPKETVSDAASDETVSESDEGVTDEQVQEEEAPPLIGGKFKTVDDLLHAYEHVESLAGRMAWERDQALSYFEQQQQQAQQQQQVQAQPVDWDELIDERPHVAANLAYERGDQMQLMRAMQAWDEIQPGQPEIWARLRQLEQQQQQIRTVADEGAERARSERVKEEVQGAVEAVALKYPDFWDHLENVSREVAFLNQGGNLALAQALDNGTHEQRVAILENLYHAARSKSLLSMNEAAQQAARSHVDETLRAKQEAMTVSATTSGGNTESPAERLGKQWDNLQAPLADGWLTTD